MDIYQFIASLVKSLVSLAWPAAFVIAVWMFREKITELLPLLRLKYKDLDVTFRLDQAEREAMAINVPEQETKPTPEEATKFSQLVAISPASAVLERSRELESAVAAYAEAQGVSISRARNLLTITRELRRHELIDQPTSALLDDLRVVRNAAAHGDDRAITEVDAKRFGELANKAIAQFNIATGAAEQLRQNLPVDFPGRSP